MSGKLISDKALIRSYLKKKGISRGAFGSILGFSRSFLDSDGTVTVDNLRKIIRHEEFSDFNTEAFLEQIQEEMVKEPGGLLSSEISNQSFLVEAVAKLAELKYSQKDISQEDAHKLISTMEEIIRKFSTLSEDYHHLYKEHEQLYRTVARESK